MSIIIGQSISDTFHKRVATTPHKTAIIRKKSGTWVNLTWNDVDAKVFEIAIALIQQGVKRGDHVAILSQTRPEWTFLDYAIMSLGAVTVPVYAAVTADDVFQILKDSGASGIFVEDAIQLEKVRSLETRLKDLKFVVCIEGSQQQSTTAATLETWVGRSLETEIKQKNRETLVSEWRALANAIQPNDLATLVYTSGTLGVPKGVELSHQNFLAILGDLSKTIQLTDRDVTLFFLPAAHIMGRIEPMMGVAVGLTNAYAESVNALIDNLIDIRPTILVSVPRIYEKLYTSIMNRVSSEWTVHRQGFKLALETGRAYSRLLQDGKKPDPLLSLQYAAADRLFFKPIREKLGGRLRFAISGGATLSRNIDEFFHACGVLVLEGYGLTECTGPACLNRPHDFRFGTVGKPLPSCEVTIASDGEVLVRGPMVTKTYHQLSDETRSAFEGGWFHTGDIGEIDADGFVRITDRKKDIIVTSGGKNISPQKIENLVKADPLFSNVMVVGEARPYLAALMTLNSNEARRLCEEKGLAFENVATAIENEAFFRVLREKIDAVNAQLPSFETVKRFRILPREFSLDAGELTPSLKIRRRFCSEKYADLIDAMYNS